MWVILFTAKSFDQRLVPVCDSGDRSKSSSLVLCSFFEVFLSFSSSDQCVSSAHACVLCSGCSSEGFLKASGVCVCVCVC